MAVFRYEDRPGIVGTVGRILGEAGVNIAGMQVSRDRKGGHALVAMTVDSAIPTAVLDEIVARDRRRDRPPGRPHRLTRPSVIEPSQHPGPAETGETRPRARPTVEACGRSSYFVAAAGPASRAGSPSRSPALARPRDDRTRGAPR